MTQVIITARDSGGANQQGSVTAILERPLIRQNDVVTPTPITASLVNGQATLDLPASQIYGIPYRITIRVNTTDPTRTKEVFKGRAFVPDSPTPLTLSQLLEIPIPDGYSLTTAANTIASIIGTGGSGGSGGAVNSVNGLAGTVVLTTSNISEGSNQYFTQARSRGSVSALAPLSYTPSTGVFSIQQANGSQPGFLSSADWTTFNNKQNALGYLPLNPANNLSELSATATTARANLGLGSAATEPSTAFQANSTELTGLAGLTSTGFLKRNGAGTYSAASLVAGDIPDLSGSYVVPSRAIATSGSLTGGGDLSSNRTLSLVNDQPNPGASRYYGTDGTGAKGWFNLPSGGSGGTTLSSTDELAEGTNNLYFTQARARGSLSGSGAILYDGVTGAISIQTASSSQTGALSSTDWQTFNSKQNALGYTPQVASAELTAIAGLSTLGFLRRTATGTYTAASLASGDIPDISATYQSVSGFTTHTSSSGNGSHIPSGGITNTHVATGAAIAWAKISKSGAVPADVGAISLTSLSATAPIAYNNTTGVFSLPQASGSQNGFLSSTDWTTFNSKQNALGFTPANATVTVTGGTSLAGGGDLSANRTITLINDSASPGASRYYGTDGTGAKGWFSLPAGGGGSFDPASPGPIGATTPDSIRGYRPVVAVSTSRAIASGDANVMLLATAAVTITVPLDSTLNLPVGTEIEILRDSSGAVTIAQETSGVAIRRADSSAVTGHSILSQYGAVLLKKVAANEWRLFGGYA